MGSEALRMKSEFENCQSSKRDENSLYTLTKKFVRIVKNSPDHFVNMSQAAEALNVGKRRIYDITNVLEGLGLVSKWSVNSVKWVGSNMNEVLSSEGEDAASENLSKHHTEEEITLDKEIEDLTNEIADMSQNPSMLENAYITYEDLQQLGIFQ
ncbi:MAG: hypothetical protein QWI73_06375, partial [Alphaproteobacteria bacterium]|nr:hypothetical protein [Alphaproteobacteria bacterium]